MRNLHDTMNDQLETSHPIYEGAIDSGFYSMDELELVKYSFDGEK